MHLTRLSSPHTESRAVQQQVLASCCTACQFGEGGQGLHGEGGVLPSSQGMSMNTALQRHQCWPMRLCNTLCKIVGPA